ncbi:hypothetical protein Tco_0052968 [Tanacetum coccineum]
MIEREGIIARYGRTWTINKIMKTREENEESRRFEKRQRLEGVGRNVCAESQCRVRGSIETGPGRRGEKQKEKGSVPENDNKRE